MSDILFEQRGCVGLVTLNRVKALNALTLDMVHALDTQLDLWRDDDTISCVVLVSASEKAFCAGGDIRKVWEGRANPPLDFFWHEYRLNNAIHHYSKPYISLINGIVMGGGVGISMHGRYVVVSENTTFAMPEVGIGFFPDVGGSYLLPRMKGQSGTYCAMSGARLKQGDCLKFGLATHAINAENFDAILSRLSDGEPVDDVLNELALIPEPTVTDEESQLIDSIFGGATVADIISALRESTHPFAAKALAQIETKSPTSVYIALAEVRRGASLDFEDCMRMEFRIVSRILQDDDFYEGVRATLVDKDGAPNWNPKDFALVNADRVEAHFAPLQDSELTFKSS
ncbi:enoyl-CoA hydratase/isomerase family protein [Cohaesibacter celericrescens]|uniref:enoyl-CoA hydratase/isomerase family protein n=1 Tax=Cohaesibacter celericrescens TaxID=2067669 RepID=UPI003562E8D0